MKYWPPAYFAMSWCVFQQRSYIFEKASFTKWNDATSHICQLSMRWPHSCQSSDGILIARFPSCLFLAPLLICNVSDCSVCSQQTNIKLQLMPHCRYERRYDASGFLKRSPLFWAEMFLVCLTFISKILHT